MNEGEIVNEIREYTDEQGRNLFREWVTNLRDEQAARRIADRIERMKAGNFGDVRMLGQGLSEMRIHYGPGYRLYYGREGERIYLLLCGGDKSSQSRDIEKARAYWQDHKRRQRT